MIKKPLLIIITGYPGAGKSYLSNMIHEKFNFVSFNRDAVSKLLYDSLDLHESDWKGKYLQTSFAFFYMFIETVLKADVSVVADGSFNPKYDNEKIRNIQKITGCEIIQVYLRIDKATAIQRYNARKEDPRKHGKDHPMHFARITPEKLEEILDNKKREKLDTESLFFEYDTSDFTKTDYTLLLEEITRRLQ